MEEETKLDVSNEKITREAPQLVALLKEMKGGLDGLRTKVQTLTMKVKEDQYPTADGISYLETKHLLLLNYCQSLVYYLLRKAKGIPIEGHSVVRSLIEIRLFLEKIRPIDKKLEYQIQKLTKVSRSTAENVGSVEKDADANDKADDLLKYRPNPDMLSRKSDMDSEDGVYRPPKFSRTSMEEDKVSKEDRLALRKDREILRQARQNPFTRELMNDFEGRPEEVKEDTGDDNRLIRYKARMEERARREEEQFIRVPLTKMERKKMKHMRNSRNGSLGVKESFYDEIKHLPLEASVSGQTAAFTDGAIQEKMFNKRKRRH